MRVPETLFWAAFLIQKVRERLYFFINGLSVRLTSRRTEADNSSFSFFSLGMVSLDAMPVSLQRSPPGLERLDVTLTKRDYGKFAASTARFMADRMRCV